MAVFYLPENRDLFLIQYIGDDSLAVDQPHIHLNVIKELYSMSQCHSIATFTPVLNPRNKQVENHKTIERQRFRVSHDELYNIHEIAYDLTGFIP